MTTPLKRYPAGPVTPHGAYEILHDRIPQVSLSSYDDTIIWNMMGGLAIADKINAPGRAEITDLKGLIPPWRIIDQKGATQDGVSFVDALYDPTMVEMNVRIKGKTPAECQRIRREFIDSLDAKQEAQLSWFTHKMGYWWAPIRWFGGGMTDSVTDIKSRAQNLALRLRADSAFWQSFPTVDDFTFSYTAAGDDFATDDGDDLGSGWTVALSGPGTGGVHIENGEITPTMVNDRTMVARKSGYTSTTDFQVGEVRIGTYQNWHFPLLTSADIWCRMNNSGTPGTSGIRLRIYPHRLRLSYFIGGNETLIRERILIIPPLAGERFRLVCGVEGGERTYSVMRSGGTIWTLKETGTDSPLGAANRSAGLGLHTETSEKPVCLTEWSVGDNVTVSQSTFLELFNVGDQPMWITYQCHGPGTFKFWNGPNADENEYVQFGPLEDGQIMYIRTAPNKRGVVDMTVIQPSPQQLDFWQQALKDFLSFATGSNTTPLATEIESQFGILPPQGNPYSLLKGRWSVPIPAKSPSKPAEAVHIKVAIDDGNANSKIIASGTPLRRMPY